MPRFRLSDSYDPRNSSHPDRTQNLDEADEADDLHERFDQIRIDRRARRPEPASELLPRVVTEGRSGHQTPDVDVGDSAGDHHVDEESPYSSYDVASHGPAPAPDWLVTSLSARDTRLGVIKSGKEADVGLLERALPGGPGCLLAVKTFRDAHRRMFHRDAGYQEGRRVRRSRETRAMAARTGFGRELLAGKWATAEFGALSALWVAGARVPYPVQLIGSELMMEFIGDPDGTAAPRLAVVEASTAEFTELWHDLVGTLDILAENGLTHGDLSPYNVLVDDTRCVVIDLPQVVDVVANPSGPEFLARDCRNIAEFFARRGVLAADTENLTLRLSGLARP